MKWIHIAALAASAVGLLLGCGDSSSGPSTPTPPPTVFAGKDTIVSPGGTITLHGSAQAAGGTIIRYEWMVEGRATPASQADSAVVTVPAQPDSNFLCVLRATDNSGSSAADTLDIWVTDDPDVRIRSPNGGEVLRIGDTLRIVLWPVNSTVGLKLLIGDNYAFTVPPGIKSNINPAQKSVFAFAIPESFPDQVWDAATQKYKTVQISTVSDSCKIRQFDYFQTSRYVESEGFFSIKNP